MNGKPTRAWTRWGVFGLIALGAAVLWALTVTFAASPWIVTLQSIEPGRVAVTYGGEVETTGPLTASQPMRTRTTSGEVVVVGVPLVTERSIYAPPTEYGFWNAPRGWSLEQMQTRLMLAAVDSEPTWYLVCDDSPEGYGFVMGFDPRTKLSVGCVGRQGLVAGTPPRSEQFVTRGIKYRCLESAENSRERAFCFFDEDRLVSVNLTTYTTRTLATIPNARSLVHVTIVDDAEAARLWRLATDEDVERPRVLDIKETLRMLVWSDGMLSLIDPNSGGRVDFGLPPGAPRVGKMSCYCLTEKKLAVAYSTTVENPTLLKFAWLTPRGSGDGVATPLQEFQLGGRWRTPDRGQATVFAGVFPAPIFLMAYIWLYANYGLFGTRVATLPEALRFALSEIGPGLAVIVVTSMVLAWWVYRSERGAYRSRAFGMAAVVFALGVPGFLAWLVERRRSPMGRCAACGKNVPQDQGLCAACGAERARPRVTGVEVFA